MEKTNGYIYVRYHNAYENACKLGKASNIPERDSQYATGELKRGFFKLVFKIQNENMGKIEVMLQEEFYNLNIRYDGGTEFYDKKITAFIEPYLIEKEINYLKLSDQEIEELVRPNRKKEEDNLIHQVEKLKITNSNYTPRDYQKDIIQKSVLHFQTHDKGVLVLTCGMGKTLLSLWVAQDLKSNTILIGVPSKLLLKQDFIFSL